MIVILLCEIGQEWARHVRGVTEGGVTVLEARDCETATGLLQAVPADLLITEVPEFTQRRLDALERLRTQAPRAELVCVAPREVIERFRHDGIPEPDLWLASDTGPEDRDAALAQAIETARLRAQVVAVTDVGESGMSVLTDSNRAASDLEVFHRLMGGFTGGFDLDRLLEAYVDAVTRFSRCASYCLLWEIPEGLGVRLQQGMAREVVEGAQLAHDDALPSWYRRNRRVLVATELGAWPDRQLAGNVARELALFGGQIALPFMVRGRLAGIILLGAKVLGDSYSAAEVETLFAVSNYVAMAAEGIELHQELRRAKAYTDRIVEGMAAGMITLGCDGRVAVCNPYAAQVLGLDRSAVQGADLRELPSPLGDMLYAAVCHPERTTSPKEVSIHGGRVVLRVATSVLLDDDGELLGSALMLDDMTAEKELALERSRAERLDVLNKIVGRIAHEVKNPLTAVKTYAELISDRGADERLAGFWSQTVLPEIDHLDELLKNLLRMVEQPEPHVEVARMDELMEQAMRVLPIPEETKRQSFDLQYAEDLPTVLVDPAPTRDALSYLMRYMAGSRPYPVAIAIGRDAQDPSRVTITMSRRSGTNGQFDPETVFDPLHAMQNPESDLGPVISRKIIANQDGRVEAICSNGRVTMLVSLPRAGYLFGSGSEVS